MHEALYYRVEDPLVCCELCPRECRLAEGQAGACGVRRAAEGRLFTLNYNRCASLAVDPIEKKPLYHFYPGWRILSAGTFGCNLHCSFCQNWSLARGESRGTEHLDAGGLLQILQGRPPRERLGVAYTYNEPSVWYEFVLEASRLLHGHGYKNVLVSNGLINPKPLAELLPFIHAMNIDVKAFSDDFYRQYCRATGGKGLAAVLRTVEKATRHCHVELTYLVITTLNDSTAEIEQFVSWVAALDREIPVHFSRYYPQYRLELPPTPVETLQRVWETAREKLAYVYLGNVPDGRRSSTYCPTCSRLLIERHGYGMENCGLDHKKCRTCGNTIRLTGHIYGEGCE
ncbi:MAG: AmmeMemoRadiSam system radical SAM enzyme [Bacillota bacterium]